MSRLRAPSFVALALSFVALGFSRPSGAVDVPAGFVVENAVPGAVWDLPVAIAFLPDGRWLVAEKAGKVYAVTNGVRQSTPVIDRSNEVLSNDDRGLLGLAVDPNFASNRFVYLLYTVDPDSNGTDDNDDAFGRLTRYRLADATPLVADASSRTILMGASWREGAGIGSGSHTIGDLQWGADGSLLVSIGDGAQFNYRDWGGGDADLFGPTKTDPLEDIGAFRAQYLGSLAGKLLRIDPANGNGYPSNPFWDGNPKSVRSRIWSYGLRNPFRFTVRPGTGVADPAAGNPGALLIGDVGWYTWEEQNLADRGGLNFGWPCYEGSYANDLYQDVHPPRADCTTIGTPSNPSAPAFPIITTNHGSPVVGIPGGFIGNAAVGGVFYTASLYPSPYRQRYFFADYGANFIKVATLDAANRLVSVAPFADFADAPVDLGADPVTGDILYVSISTNQVRRIRTTAIGGNSNPIASAAATPEFGAAPLAVAFSSAGSFDPDGDPVTLSWSFGDGQGSNLANPPHTYTNAGSYSAVLTATDGRGGVGRDTAFVVATSVAGFPSTPVLDDFNRANGALGGAWVGSVTGLSINSNALVQTQGGYVSPVWNGAVFGPDQEVYVTLGAITPSSPEHDLLLKVQGQTYDTGHLEVRYDPSVQTVSVSTYTPGTSWANYGSTAVTFAAGDRFGARAYANGRVEVYRNGALLTTRSVAGWPFAANGGRLGMTIADATTARFDDFGGGSVLLDSNTPPQATILAPADGAWFVAGQAVALRGRGSDAQDAAGALTYRWEVDLHHNNHVHPKVAVASDSAGSFLAENHDDGTGVHYRVRLIVTDTGGKSSTAEVLLYPEVDLEAVAATVTPAPAISGAEADYRLVIRNRGRMPAPRSRWALLLDGAHWASGDTLVAPLDSVVMVRRLVTTAAVGTHTLRVRVDSLGAVSETQEGNNAAMSSFAVARGPNHAPVAVATATPLTGGAPLSVTLSSAGTADLDGDPLTLTWDFGDGTTGSGAAPVHVYSVAGAYSAILTAADAYGGVGRDTVTITVQVAASVAERRISAGADDAEESSTGAVSLTSSDLEFMVDGATQRAVGLRFVNLAIPPGATITRAWVQFAADEIQSELTTITFMAQAVDHAPAFTTASGSLSARIAAATAARVTWGPIPTWAVIDGFYQTPELKTVIQEVVSRPGWSSGNALVLLANGTGHRTARAADEFPAVAPLLHVEFSAGGPPPPPPPPPVNQAPVVSAGPDQTITLPADVALDGAVTDDGLPAPPARTVAWSKVSGPGTVTFTSPSLEDTRAAFSAAGTYLLQLQASDGALTARDTAQIVVQPAGTAVITREVRVNSQNNDAEEFSNGAVDLGSSDLEFMTDGAVQRVVGMRFTGVSIPVGAVISRAYIQFKVDEAQSVATTVTLLGQAADNPGVFTSASNSLTARVNAGTAARVTWGPIPAWGVVGALQQTPDLKTIVQEIVNRPGWRSGNAMVLLVTGTGGHRTAVAYNGNPAGAPLLHVEYAAAASASGIAAASVLEDVRELEFKAWVVPNPLRGSGVLNFVLPRAGAVSIDVFDASGRRVAEVARAVEFSAGPHSADLAVRRERWSAGLYFYRVTMAGKTITGRFAVLE